MVRWDRGFAAMAVSVLMAACVQRPDLKLDNPRDPLSPTYAPAPPAPPGVPPPEDMVFMPAVTGFSMGRPSWESGNADEQPVHAVNLSAFYISKYEVTVAQSCEFLNSGGQDSHYDPQMDNSVECGIKRIANGQYEVLPGRGNYPVTYVSWDDATAYCAWLSAKTGKTWRLPTEAEWEYAATGGNPHRTYPWGNPWEGTKLNYLDSPPGSVDGYAKTAPVGTYAGGQSPHGLFNMAGNVGEWVKDWYSATYYSIALRTILRGPAAAVIGLSEAARSITDPHLAAVRGDTTRDRRAG